MIIHIIVIYSIPTTNVSISTGKCCKLKAFQTQGTVKKEKSSNFLCSSVQLLYLCIPLKAP